MPAKTNRIAFQGEPGANSDTACRNVYPEMEPLPCPTFEDAFNAVETGKADLAMIPIENTIAGRVADIHHLLAGIAAAHRRRIFPADPFPADGAAGRRRIEDIKTVHSHIHALGQCRKIHPQDTAGSRWSPATRRAPPSSSRKMATARMAALAPRLAADALRPRHPRGECRGHRNQRHPLRRADQEQGVGRARRRAGRADDDHLHLPRAQRSGRALQGDGRLRHQRRQHDQAGELPARRQVHRDAVLCRHRGPSRRRQRRAGA